MSITEKNGRPPDLIEGYSDVSDYATETNRYEVYCGTCSKIFYTDKDNSAKWMHSIGQDIDNSFVCDECQRAEDEMAHSEH